MKEKQRRAHLVSYKLYYSDQNIAVLYNARMGKQHESAQADQ